MKPLQSPATSSEEEEEEDEDEDRDKSDGGGGDGGSDCLDDCEDRRMAEIL